MHSWTYSDKEIRKLLRARSSDLGNLSATFPQMDLPAVTSDCWCREPSHQDVLFGQPQSSVTSERLNSIIQATCQCSLISFPAPSQPLKINICHCLECRHQSSSAFSISVIFLPLTYLIPPYQTRSHTLSVTLKGEKCDATSAKSVVEGFTRHFQVIRRLMSGASVSTTSPRK